MQGESLAINVMQEERCDDEIRAQKVFLGSDFDSACELCRVLWILCGFVLVTLTSLVGYAECLDKFIWAG